MFWTVCVLYIWGCMTSAASDPGCRGHTPSHISLELLDSASTSGAHQSPCRNISRWQIETGANRGSAVKQNHSIVSPELGNFIALCGYPLVKMELEIQTRFLPRLPFFQDTIISDNTFGLNIWFSFTFPYPSISPPCFWQELSCWCGKTSQGEREWHTSLSQAWLWNGY